MVGLRRTFIVSLSLGTAVLIGTLLLIQIREVPKLSAVKKSFRSENLTVLDRHGQVIDEVLKKQAVRRLNWIDLDQISPSFIEAVLQNEDWRLSPNSITRQLAQSGLFPSLALEMVWSRKEILEAYVNLSVYRGELQGIAAASQALFDRSPDKLTRAQGAVLAALIRSKNQTVDGVQSKACKLLKSLKSGEDCGLITPQHLANIEKSYRVKPFVKMAPHAAAMLADIPDLRDGNEVRSTLDRDWQWEALNALKVRDETEGAVVVLENSTGNVLVYVGNAGIDIQNSQQDFASQPREVGGSLKPFLYAKALDERTLTAASAFDEKLPNIQLRQALNDNLKLPAVRALDLLGVDVFVQTLRALGITGLANPEQYGPSLALGSAQVKLIELTNAYRALANRGVWSPLRFSPSGSSDTASRRVFSEAATFIVTDMIKLTEGSHWAAVYCDQWCVGFSEKYTLGVRGGGKELWLQLFQTLHKSEASQPPPVPNGLTEQGGELFLEGTINEKNILPRAKPGFESRITYPIDGSVIDLESSRQNETARFYILVAAPNNDQNLYLNGRRLGRAHALQAWKPLGGDHVLELRDSKGHTLHRVKFTVKGIGLGEG